MASSSSRLLLPGYVGAVSPQLFLSPSPTADIWHAGSTEGFFTQQELGLGNSLFIAQDFDGFKKLNSFATPGMKKGPCDSRWTP